MPINNTPLVNFNPQSIYTSGVRSQGIQSQYAYTGIKTQPTQTYAPRQYSAEDLELANAVASGDTKTIEKALQTPPQPPTSYDIDMADFKSRLAQYNGTGQVTPTAFMGETFDSNHLGEENFFLQGIL